MATTSDEDDWQRNNIERKAGQATSQFQPQVLATAQREFRFPAGLTCRLCSVSIRLKLIMINSTVASRWLKDSLAMAKMVITHIEPM